MRRHEFSGPDEMPRNDWSSPRRSELSTDVSSKRRSSMSKSTSAMGDRHIAADHDALVEHVVEQIAEHELLGVELVVVIIRHGPPRSRNDMEARVQ